MDRPSEISKYFFDNFSCSFVIFFLYIQRSEWASWKTRSSRTENFPDYSCFSSRIVLSFGRLSFFFRNEEACGSSQKSVGSEFRNFAIQWKISKKCKPFFKLWYSGVSRFVLRRVWRWLIFTDAMRENIPTSWVRISLIQSSKLLSNLFTFFSIFSLQLSLREFQTFSSRWRTWTSYFSDKNTHTIV